jgi:YVTN family beta-propeller protein
LIIRLAMPYDVVTVPGGVVGYSLGVDLGTTFVAAAIASETRFEMFALGDHSVAAPAIVYVSEDGTLIVAGEVTNLRAVNNPDRVGRGFKRRLGNPTPVILGGQPYTVTSLLGALLRDILGKVEETEGQPPDRVVLTYPANWGHFQRELFEEVPRYAGLSSPAIVTESEATAAYYATSRQFAEGEIVAVYDLGGGGFGATILRQLPSRMEILGTPEVIERLGGVDFDEAILSFVDYAADGAFGESDLRDPRSIVARARLRQDCILAKEALSVDTETVIPVLLPGRQLDVRIMRSEFENMVRAQIESTIGALLRTMRSAQVEPSDLSAVLLVGGSSRIPLVAQIVSAELGRPIVADAHPKYPVALGAAELAAEMASTVSLPTGTPSGSSRQQRGTQQPVSAAIPTGLIPAQRTSLNETVTAPIYHTPVGGAARQDSPPIIPVQPLEPTTRPPPVVSLPPLDNGDAQSRDEPTPPSQRTALDAYDRGASSSIPSVPSPSNVLVPSLQRWFLIAAVTLLMLVLGGTIAVMLLPESNQPESGSSQPTEPKVGPEGPIPTRGATISVGTAPVFVAVSPNGHYAYIANRDIQAITVLDTAINQVTATIPIPSGPPQFLAFAPDGRMLYVTIYNDQQTIHVVDVISTATNTVVATIPQPARPFLPAVTPDGKQLYIPNHDIASVSVVDAASNKIVAQIKVPPNPHWVAFSADGARAYTANHESNLISVIDTGTRQVIATVPVGSSPHSVAVHPNRPLVADVNYDADSVTMTDTESLKVVATVFVGKNPRDIVWAPDGRFAYVANEGSNNVSVIDAATNQVTATIATGATPSCIAVLPNSRRAYVSNSEDGTLTVLELAK